MVNKTAYAEKLKKANLEGTVMSTQPYAEVLPKRVIVEGVKPKHNEQDTVYPGKAPDNKATSTTFDKRVRQGKGQYVKHTDTGQSVRTKQPRVNPLWYTWVDTTLMPILKDYKNTVDPEMKATWKANHHESFNDSLLKVHNDFIKKWISDPISYMMSLSDPVWTTNWLRSKPIFQIIEKDRLEPIVEKSVSKALATRPVNHQWADDPLSGDENPHEQHIVEGASVEDLEDRFKKFVAHVQERGVSYHGTVVANQKPDGKAVHTYRIVTKFNDQTMISGFGTFVKWMSGEIPSRVVKILMTNKHLVFGKDMDSVPVLISIYEPTVLESEIYSASPLQTITCGMNSEMQMIPSAGFDLMLLRSKKFECFPTMDLFLGDIHHAMYLHTWAPTDAQMSTFMPGDDDMSIRRSGTYTTKGEGSSGSPILYVDTNKKVFVVGVHYGYSASAEANLWIRIKSQKLFEVDSKNNHLNWRVPQGCAGWTSIKDAENASLMGLSNMRAFHTSLGGKLTPSQNHLSKKIEVYRGINTPIDKQILNPGSITGNI